MFESIWPILQVILGIGLVIFVHEAGHFVAARWCKVRVHVFSLGFGPRLVGWTRGHTEYKISAVPLGGYVRMAGDESFTSGRDAKPWELGSKSVGQRFLIYSGGVIANLLFGLIVFPILFAVGIPSITPVVGGVERGSPAWHARLEEGTRIRSVNGVDIYDLLHIAPEVAYSGDRKVVLDIVPPGSDEPRTIELQPVYDEQIGAYSIGMIRPSVTPDLAISGVAEGGAAKLAGLRDGDHFVAVEGQPAALTPREQLGRALRGEEPFRATFEREGGLLTVEIVPRTGEDGYHRLGITCPYRLLASVRESERTRSIGLKPDDRVLSIAGRALYSNDDSLAALLGAEGPIEWIVQRGNEELRLESPALDEEQRVELYRDLDLRPDEASTVLSVSPGEAAEAAGLRTGDRVLAIDGQEITNYEATRKASLAAGKAGRTLQFKISRSGREGAEPEILEIEATPEFHAYADPGFGLTPLKYTFRVTDPGEAVLLGTISCWNMLLDVGRTLRGIMRQEVSGKSVGGIITISVFAHDTAKAGWVKFFWFLCLLSINLAFLNVLPIPLLDGGHLFFLLVEGIKGSPVSERILSYSQLVGLVLIVSIFVFVIYNDLTRFDIFGLAD